MDDILSIQYCRNNGMSNTLINAIVNEKKLEFSESKCSNLSIGNLKCQCNKRLRVNESRMKQTVEETYLGNQIHSYNKKGILSAHYLLACM